MKGHVIIAGYGTLARRLASALEAANVDFLITTLNPDGARDAEAHGWRVLRGDAGRAAFLQAAGLENSATLVIPDDLPEKAHTVVSVARGIAPHVRIVVWTPAAANADEMHDHGADRVVNDQDATADALLSAVLRGLGRRGLDLEALLAYGQDDMPALERPIDVRKPVRMLVDPNSMAARKSKHLGAIREVYPMAPGCVECLRHGNTDWVHLRICMTTGYVGCCDASHGHMRQHYERTGHPIMRSLEPGEDWGWSYPEEMMIPALPDPNAPAVDAEVEIEAEAEADRA
ncbi:MAG: NAD-binding protein [Acidobacteriota bacterium]